MGQSHSRRSSTQNNGPTSSTSANGRVDGAPAGRTTTDARKPVVPEDPAATTSSPRPRHVRSKSAATDKESNNWRKRLSSTFGKRRRSSKMGKEGMGSGFADVDELGAVAGAAEPAADVPEHDEVYSAAAERQEAAADGSAPQSPQPTAASPPLPSSRPRSTSAEAAPIANDVVPEASTPEVPSGLSHDTAAQQEGAAPQASSPSAPYAFADGALPVATEPSSPSPPDAPDAAPAQTHAPPTGVLLVQGIVQTRDIRVDSGESSRSSDELPSSPEPEATPTDSSERATSTDTAITGPEPAVASSPALDSASASGRRRLSTLLSSLRRRSSGYSSDRATRASASNERLAQSAAASRASLGSTTAADAPAQTEHLADAGTAPTSSGAHPATSIHPAPTAQPTTGTQPTAGTHRHGRADAPLPNHTIDVLSTYLSLAAAATAASLLTGSADPIVNSGLVGQGHGNGEGNAGTGNSNAASTRDTRATSTTSPAAVSPSTVPASPEATTPSLPPASPPLTSMASTSTAASSALARPIPASTAPVPTLARPTPTLTPPTPSFTPPVPPSAPSPRRPAGRRYQGNRARSAYDRLGLTSNARRSARREDAEDAPASANARGAPGTSTADDEEVEEVIGWRQGTPSTATSAASSSATPAQAAAAELARVTEEPEAVSQVQPSPNVAPSTPAQPAESSSSDVPTSAMSGSAGESSQSQAVPAASATPRRDYLLEQLAQRREQHRQEEQRLARQREMESAEDNDRRERSRERREAFSTAMGHLQDRPSTNAGANPAPPSSGGLAELARALRSRLGIPQDGASPLADEHDEFEHHHHGIDEDLWAPFPDEDDENDLFGDGHDANLSPTSFESFLRELRNELRTALGGGVPPPPEEAEDDEEMPGLEPVAHTAPRSPLSVEEDNDDDMPALEAVEEAAAQRPQHAAPVPGATSPAANMSERDRLLDVLAGIGGLFGGGNDTGPDAAAARARQARQARRSVSVRNRALPSIPQTRPQRERLGALGGVRSSGGRTSTPEGGVNWWSMYRFAPVVVSPVNPANINVNATATTGPSGPAANTPISPANVAPSSTPSAQANGTAPLPSLADAHVVFPVIIVGIQSIENIFGLGGENAPPPAPPASADRQARDDERTPLLDAQEDREEDDAAESPSDDPSRAPWRSRAADAVRRTIRRARGTTGEGAGDAQTDTDGARPTEAPSSRTFAMYVIGAYYPPTHALLTSPPPPTFDALLELADLANLGNLGAIGLAMGGLGSRAATVSKEQIEKSELTVVKAKDLVVWTPKEGEKEPEVDTAVTAVRDSCIERCLICLDSYEAEDEVRVMSCRHAFHKNCVDTWMETGKNNCPFCRGKGVDTNSQPAAAATAAAA